jgi:glycerate kinase
LTRGAPLVVEAAGLDDALRGARVAITGEGRVDRQTAYGKGPAEVIKRARAAKVAAVVIAGSLGEGWETLDVPVITLGEGRVSTDELMQNPEPWLEEAAGRAVAEATA